MLSNQCADNNFHGAFMNPAHLNYDEEKRYSAKLRPGNIFRLIPNVWFLKSKKKNLFIFYRTTQPRPVSSFETGNNIRGNTDNERPETKTREDNALLMS